VEETKLTSNYGQQIGWQKSKDSGQPPNTRVTQEDRDWLEKTKARTAVSAATTQKSNDPLTPPVQIQPLIAPGRYEWDTAPADVQEVILKFCREARLNKGSLIPSVATISLRKLKGWCRVKSGGKDWRLKDFTPTGGQFCSIVIYSGDLEASVSLKLVDLVRAFPRVS
jgi:hypothetical protein